MPDADKRRETTRVANTQQAEKNRDSKRGGAAKTARIEDARQDREASERMVDEGGPNPKSGTGELSTPGLRIK